MKLLELIKDCDGRITGSQDVEISDLSYNTSNIQKGSCFVALKGEKTDGHKFIADAIKKGAAAVVCQDAQNVPEKITSVIVKNSRDALAKMSARFFSEPSKDLKLVGVTGTNGKTTITYIIEAIFKKAGLKPGVIGTVEYRFGGKRESAPHTTPESYDLQKLFMKMKEAGADSCVMEVSSHSLVQDRVAACNFDAAVFTNLTPEHLDYHNDMDSYFAAKAILFEKLLKTSSKKNPFAVINADDPYGLKLKKSCPVDSVMYGFSDAADIRAEDVSFNSNGLSMRVLWNGKKIGVRSPLCGRFNAANILAAASVALKMKISPEIIAEAVAGILSVPGRFEAVPNSKGVLALVDYAHTPDALSNVLTNARELVSKDARLIVVFGCGGDRDRKKRPLMGKAAAELSDIAFVTSDNPRTEAPLSIIEEILPGVREKMVPVKNGHGFLVIEDRRSAIERAVKSAREGDVLVVAGKGHEDYQILGTKKIHFDDKEELARAFS